MNISKIIFAVLVSIAFFSCKPQSEKDDEIIQEYLKEHSLEATKHESGIYYIIQDEGTGETYPDINSEVEVRYKGYFIDGDIFDQTQDSSTFTYELSYLISGWQHGIPLIKRGGKETLFIPSALGYGEDDYYTIPGNSVLIFEIELVDFQ